MILMDWLIMQVFDQLIKSKQKVYEKIFRISKTDDYITENLLHFLYHQNYYKLNGIDLSKETNTSISQQISFVK